MDAPARRQPAPLIVLLFGAAIGVLAGMVWAIAAPAGYSAAAGVFVSTQGAQAVDDLHRQAALDQRASDSYSSVATAPIVIDPVAEQLGVGAIQLRQRVSAERPAGTALVRIRVQDPSAARAAITADAVAARLVAVAPALTPRTGTRAPDVHLTQVQRASAASATAADGTVPVLLGLIAGAGAAVLVLVVPRLRRHRRPVGGGPAAPTLL